MFPSLLRIICCPSCGSSGRLRIEHTLSESETGELLDGILRCDKCSRWYRVEEGIPDLVRDALREVADERAFLRRYEEQIPAAILEEGSPVSLSSEPPEPSAQDQKILEEGRYWGRFMRHFWDVGDRSIFDMRIKGTHPPFYPKGVLEPDDRDERRSWGIYPRYTGELLFSRLSEMKGRRAIDVGCGGGQFGLEAARQGLDVAGFDPSFEEVRLARLHAREEGMHSVEYIRGEPAHPPFQPKTFGVFMAKDSLHHVPELPRVISSLLPLLTADAYAIVHEHVARAERKERFMNRIAPRLVEKIRRRYPTVDVPLEFQSESANEDTGSASIRQILYHHFEPLAQCEDLFLADELELLFYFAYGKRRWVAKTIHFAGTLIERFFLLRGDHQHLSYVGRRRQRAN